MQARPETLIDTQSAASADERKLALVRAHLQTADARSAADVLDDIADVVGQRTPRPTYQKMWG